MPNHTLDLIRAAGRPDVISTPRTGKPAHWFDERPATTRPLREVAQQQAALLRRLQDGVPSGKPLTAAQQAAKERTLRAMAGPAHVERPRPAPVAYATPTNDFRAQCAEADRLAAQLPVGRYALPRVQVTATGNDITFFEVVEFKSGPRKGVRRIFQLISNGSGLSQQSLKPLFQIYAAQHILEDVAAAAGLFGRTLNICAFGPHPLTNGRSRAAGYGETCARNHGLPW